MLEVKDFYPETFKALPIWGLWRLEERNGKQTKVPYNARTLCRASSTNPEDWTSFDNAQSALSAHSDEFSGLGLVILEQYHILFLDVDHCLSEDGEIDQRGADLLETFADPAQYIELSQSRTGLHAFVLGSIPRSFKNPKNGCEMYSSGRFCALTGWAISPHEPTECESAVAYWFEKYKTQKKERNENPVSESEATESDQWIIDHAKAHGGKFPDLYDGNWRGAGYESQSEADLALCIILAFWANRDPKAIDRIFRQSGLYRKKWDRSDYRESTISKAIDTQKDTLSEFQARKEAEEDEHTQEIVNPDTGEILVVHTANPAASAPAAKKRSSKKKKDEKSYRDLVLDLKDKARIRQFGKALYRIVDGKYYKLLGDIFINHELIAVRGMEPEKQKAAQTMIRSFQREENVEYDPYYVGFKNGIMNWRTGEFFPYDQQDVPIFRYFDVNYNPDADTSFVDGIITDWCQGDDVKKRMLYELAGCCFYADKPIKKWWAIEGKADTGKTTFLKLLRSTIGEDNVGSTPIQNLKDPNAIAELIDKSVNIVDDGSSKFTTDLSQLRRIIQGDIMQVKLLYQNIFSTKLESRMIFVFNRIPRFRDDNDATAKKMLMIGFNRVYSDEEKDIDLIGRLTSEGNKEAFVKLAIDGMKCVLSKNLTFTVSEESRRVVDQIVQDSDQFASFAADTISEDYSWKRLLDGKTTKDVYTRFWQWATDEGYKNILVQRTFTERCCKESGAHTRPSNGYRWYCFDD